VDPNGACFQKYQYLLETSRFYNHVPAETVRVSRSTSIFPKRCVFTIMCLLKYQYLPETLRFYNHMPAETVRVQAPGSESLTPLGPARRGLESAGV
jgi:hypothetical protein